MVKKKNTPDTTRTEGKGGGKGLFGSLKETLTNERTAYITGLLVCLLVIYAGLAFLSFFFTGSADQSEIENVPLSDLVINQGSVENWTGVRGAVLADLFMNRWFGISSFMILVFFGTLGARLMRLTRVSLLKRFLFCAAALVWGSVFFAFAFRTGYEDSFIYLGGRHGYVISNLLTGNIGIPGVVLLLTGSFLVIAVCTSRRTVPFLQRLLSFAWLGGLFRRTAKASGSISRLKKTGDEKDKEDEGEGEKENPKEPSDVAAADDDAEKGYIYKDNEGFEITVPRDEEEYTPPAEPADFAEPEEQQPFPPNPSADDEEPFDETELGEYDPKLDLSNFRNPNIDLLKKYDVGEHQIDIEEQNANQRKIKQTLENFNISISSIKATVGPTITLYEVVPDVGVRISKIRNLEDDIALNLSALGIRIIAPMPGKGTIGIEVPNKDPQIVSMQSILASRRFQETKFDLPVALGKTITNEIFIFDLCKMPHLLVAGATGQGKSVGLNAIITSLLYKKHPSELKFVLVDPKMVEFSIYSEIERHYLAKLPDSDKAIITDFTKVIHTLNSLCIEMDDRYDLLMKAHTRNIKEYNDKFRSRRLNPEKGHRYMQYIVVIIDEFGDLIMTAGKEIELPIARIAQKARAVGIHMVIATQRPSTNIITGTIKANFPARIAFRVSSMIDSRTILDSPGANQLIGRGDLLFSQGSEMTRVQCAFIDTPEVEQVSAYIGEQTGFATAHLLPEYTAEGDGDKSNAVDMSDLDPLFADSARLLVIQQQGSTSLIQRKFSIGYNRAGRLMDQLEKAGIVGPFEGSKARQVLIQDEHTLEQKLAAING
ncbi:Stage III sporulation protein E [Bacteroidales bacterium Barb4]|nr:Stage III sporulation protein E [Bacteroidales bacterium Barb4]